MLNSRLSAEKEEKERKGKVTVPSFSRTKIAKIAVLPVTVRFGMREV